MKYIKKYIYIFVCTILLLFVAVFIASKVRLPFNAFSIYIENDLITNEVSVYHEGKQNYYVFLPSYADLDQVKISLNSRQEVSIGDVTLYDGMDCSCFELEVPYEFSFQGQKNATIWFYQSENVATMYIDTATGSMDRIHEDKNYEENASIMLYTEEGVVNYSDEESTLKGRGNATWELDKRPYLLTLSAEGNLLEMGEATTWVLLSNAYDETNLNNKLIFDLASRVGFRWTPDSRWVDVYLNGEYNGLYLLTEKIEVHENRLNIDTNSGDFLCKIDLKGRWQTLCNPFLTKYGRTVEISYPKILTEANDDTVKQLVNQMEEMILSGADLSNTDFIDMDSWVRRYLIDEISGNIDSDIASSYFYFMDGTFYAGPVWDYDMVLGNSIRNEEAFAFIAKNLKKSNGTMSPYYGALYVNESFYGRMQEIYRTEFRPVIQQIIDYEIDNFAAHIHKASQMNSMRWRKMHVMIQRWFPNTAQTPIGMKAYLTDRIRLLDSAWLEGIVFCTVQFESSPGGAYWNISVEQGSCLETTYMDLVSTVWIDNATGKPFDFSQPIVSDMILSKQTEEIQSEEELNDETVYIAWVSVAALLVLLIGLARVDMTRRVKDRRGAKNVKQSKEVV